MLQLPAVLDNVYSSLKCPAAANPYSSAQHKNWGCTRRKTLSKQLRSAQPHISSSKWLCDLLTVTASPCSAPPLHSSAKAFPCLPEKHLWKRHAK